MDDLRWNKNTVIEVVITIPEHKPSIAFVGNISSISSLVASELRKQGYTADVYQPDINTTSKDDTSIIINKKIYNVPLERTLRKIYHKVKNEYDVEILSHMPPYTKAKHRVTIYHGSDIRNNLTSVAYPCFYTTKDLAQYFDNNAVFLPRCADIETFRPKPRITVKDEIIVGHFTTQPKLKGTQLVIDAVKYLNQIGTKTKLVTGKVQREKLAESISQCHVICDQFLLANYGVLAIEALLMNRPVVCYVKDEYIDYPEMKEQITNCDPAPESIAEAIRQSIDKKINYNLVSKLYSPQNTANILIDALKAWKMI